MNKETFLELLNKVIESKPHHYAFCLKHRRGILIERLEKFECWNCEQAVFNKGNCDPI